MRKYLYSIIIPHKDIPSLLQRCLDSIPSMDDIQVVVVDDNSNSEIVDFEKFPGLNRPNTEVYFDKSGKGAGRARNIGLEHAKGEWVLFADADDVFEPEFEGILLSLQNDTKSDVVNFEVTSRNIEDNTSNQEIEKIGYHCNIPKYIKNPHLFKYIVLTPWGKAIRRSLIVDKRIKFDEVPFGNDLLFATLVDFHCKHRRIIPITGYCWMKRENSLWRQETLEWAKIRFNVLLKTACTMRKLGDGEVAERYFEGAKGFLFSILKFSKIEYLKSLIKYGMYTNDLRIIFKQAPREAIFLFKDYLLS